MDQKTQGLYFALFNEIGIISQLSRALMEARLPDGLQVTHFGVINHLIRVKDGQTPLDIARAFQVAKTTMTHTLSGLEKHGLIELRPNPEDGRSKCVWLTGKGRRFRDQAIADLEPDLAGLAEQMPRERVERLVGELVEIRKVLDASRSGLG